MWVLNEKSIRLDKRSDWGDISTHAFINYIIKQTNIARWLDLEQMIRFFIRQKKTYKIKKKKRKKKKRKK
jgi:hypothetical protein